MRHAFLIALLSAGCGHAATNEAANPPPTETASEEATAPDESASEEASDTAELETMRARAEAFVRAQGYADTPASVPPEEIVHEGIEGTVEMRRNMLDPVPVSGGPDGNGGWSFAFRYVEAEYEGRGRLLIMEPGQPPRFVHQDLLLPGAPAAGP